MKKFIIILAGIAIALNSFGQVNTDSAALKESYLLKSKSKKQSGWLLLGGGVGIAVIGLIVSGGDSELDQYIVGRGLTIGGGVAALASIPFFSSSKKYKDRAASIGLSQQPLFIPQKNLVSLKHQPALVIRIRI